MRCGAYGVVVNVGVGVCVCVGEVKNQLLLRPSPGPSDLVLRREDADPINASSSPQKKLHLSERTRDRKERKEGRCASLVLVVGLRVLPKGGPSTSSSLVEKPRLPRSSSSSSSNLVPKKTLSATLCKNKTTHTAPLQQLQEKHCAQGYEKAVGKRAKGGCSEREQRKKNTATHALRWKRSLRLSEKTSSRPLFTPSHPPRPAPSPSPPSPSFLPLPPAARRPPFPRRPPRPGP